MKKYLYVSLAVSFSLRADPDDLKTSEKVIVPDLTYEDDEKLYEKIFGHVDCQEDMLFDVDVLVDGEKVGQAPAIIGKKSKIQAAALKELLDEFLETSEIELIVRNKDADGFVDFDKLSELSVKTRLNRIKMQIEISLPLEKKKARSLGRGYKKSKQKPNAHPATISAFTNIRAAQTFYRGNHSYNTKDLIFTPAVNLCGICTEGEVSYRNSSDSTEKGKFHRDYTTIVYDWAEHDVMFKYGDVFSHSLSYQSAPRVWGFNLYKDVERERNEDFSNPIQVNLLRTSTIEVYSNNNLIRTRTNVAPGTYTFDDISYSNGANDIKIKIIDETGREQLLDESCFYESSYVPKGSFTFNGTYGYPEVNGEEKGRYDKKNPVLSTSLKYGLLPSTEIGLGLLKNKIGKTQSYEIRDRNFLGQFDFRYANSNYKENGFSIFGKVYYVQYTMPSIELIGRASLGFSASMEKSDDFFKPYLGVGATELRFDNVLKKEENLKGKTTTTTYNFYLNNFFSLNLSFYHFQKVTSDSKKSRRDAWNLSRNFNINNDWFSNCNISINFNHGRDIDGRISKSFGIYCSLSLKNNASISSGYSKTDDNHESYLSYSKYPERNGFGYEVTANKASTYSSQSVNMNYSHRLFRGNLNHSRNSLDSHITNVGLESALYFADGNFAISKPDYSDGGFTVVVPKKALADYNIKFLDKDAESGFLGGAVVQNSRTSVSSSRIDLRNLPDNLELKDDTVLCYGGYKRGFVAEISAESSIFAQGILLDPTGKPFEQVTGYAINKNDIDEKPEPFFTNSEGHFLLTNLKSGKYKLAINVEGIRDSEINVEEGNNNEVIDLGKITCEDSI